MTNRLYYSKYSPANLDLAQIIQTNEPKEIDYIKYYQYLITKIIDERIHNDKYSLHDFVSLKLEYLRNIINHRHVKTVIENLIKWQIIERNTGYQPGVKSMGYRLKENYRSLEFKVEREQDARISSNIYRHSVTEPLKRHLKKVQNNLNYNSILYDVTMPILLQNLTKWLDKLEINAPDAIAFINSDAFPKEKNRSHYLAYVQKFQIKEFYITPNDKTGRIYSTITNCPSLLLPFLSFEGQKLHEVDIANSQPLLFNLIIKEHLKKNKKEPDVDMEYFQKMTEQGIFYKCLYNDSKYSGTIENFKKMVFTIFFKLNPSNDEIIDDAHLRNPDYLTFLNTEAAFKKNFPFTFKIIEKYRSEGKNLAVELQRKESNIVLPVAIELANKFPLFTRHDSILTTENNVQIVHEALTKAFKVHKLKPKIRIKTK